MPTPSVARQFFDDLVTAADPVAAIRALINSDPPTPETDHFDCKQEERDAKKRDQKMKEIWSEVLGGFANAGGGVLIWGLDARKTTIDGREVDAVSGEAPVSNPRALESRLRELQRQATDPPLGNVEIRAFPLPEDGTRGFVVCFIPEGAHKPYRSEHAHKQYYLRAGDNTPVMGRSVLQAMFHPRATAVFKVMAITHRKQDQLGYTRVTDTVIIFLQNAGNATAKDVAVMVLCETPEHTSLRPDSRWKVMREGRIHELRAAGYSLHRRQGAPLCTVECAYNIEISDSDEPNWLDFTLHITVYCENQEYQKFQLEFEDSDFGDDPLSQEFAPLE